MADKIVAGMAIEVCHAAIAAMQSIFVRFVSIEIYLPLAFNQESNRACIRQEP